MTTPMITDVNVCGLELCAALSAQKNTPIVKRIKKSQLTHETDMSTPKIGIKLKATRTIAKTKDRPASWLKNLRLVINYLLSLRVI